MGSLSLGSVFSRAFQAFKTAPLPFAIAGLLTFLTEPFTLCILLGPALVGFARMVAELEDTGNVSLSTLFSGFNQVVPCLIISAAYVVVTVPTFTGVLFVLVVMLEPLLSIATYIVAKGENDALVAFQKAWDLYKVNFLNVLVISICLSVFGGFGIGLCGLGVFITYPINLIGEYFLAKDLVEQSRAMDA